MAFAATSGARLCGRSGRDGTLAQTRTRSPLTQALNGFVRARFDRLEATAYVRRRRRRGADLVATGCGGGVVLFSLRMARRLSRFGR
jgi:2-polyprenyl-3-methyl-5-hydroxy-6-metoxy-1,4-benzoquinol methylase